MQKYFLLLVYKPSLTKEQVEERILSEIHPIFEEYNIQKPRYTYAGNKLFAHIIKKNKSGHYVCFTFACQTPQEKKNITFLTKRINEIQDVIRVIPLQTNNPEETMESLCKMDINIDSKELYL
jgi:ribosomal protein S6